MTALHTKGQLAISPLSDLIINSESGPLGFVYGPAMPEQSEVGQRAMADARHLVHCWNCHDDLLEALKDVTRILQSVRYSVGLGKGQMERLERAKAAIAKATTPSSPADAG